MESRRSLIGLNLAGGIGLLVVTAHFFQNGDLIMALLTGVAAVAMVMLARQEFVKGRRP